MSHILLPTFLAVSICASASSTSHGLHQRRRYTQVLLFPLDHPPVMTPVEQPTQASFNPYADNGGTILAIAGLDFAVVAGDTRQTEGYSIQTRYAPKVFRLCVLRYLGLCISARCGATQSKHPLRVACTMCALKYAPSAK